MAVKKFRKANSANDGAEWWIADSVADLPLVHNPAIKAGDMAVIKPTDAIEANRYDIYMYKISPNRWEKIVDGGGILDEKVKVSSNDTTPSYLLSKIVAGANVVIVENNNGGNETITISAQGEVNTATNVGNGEGLLVKSKNGANIPIKTIKAGSNVSVVNSENEIIINANAPQVTHPLRLEECDGAIYIIGSFNGSEYAVEATAFTCNPPVCFKPIPIVASGLVVTLGVGGLATLNASDVNLGSYDNPLNTNVGIASMQISRDDVVYSDAIQIDCNDAQAGFVPIYFRVTNNCGEYDNANLFVAVQDSMGYCEL